MSGSLTVKRIRTLAQELPYRESCAEPCDENSEENLQCAENAECFHVCNLNEFEIVEIAVKEKHNSNGNHNGDQRSDDSVADTFPYTRTAYEALGSANEIHGTDEESLCVNRQANGIENESDRNNQKSAAENQNDQAD